MAFLIPDNLRSRQDVPPGIRRVASAFQVGLDEDVTVWYEPLYDPDGEKPHLVVLIPDRGIVVLEVLEVKAQKLLGVIRGRIRIERDGREVEADNPLVRAERLAGVLRSRVAAEVRLAGLEVPIAAGAVFPGLSEDEARSSGVGNVVPLERCLFRNHIDDALAGRGEAELLRAFGRMLGGRVGDPIPKDREKILRGLIQPDLVIDKIARHSDANQLTIFRPPTDGEDIVRVMDRQQEAMAKSLGSGHRVIRGVAGSGKTLVLVFRARLLARIFPSERILVTCYTRTLTGELRQALQDHPNVEVVNLDRLMAMFIREAGWRHPGYEEGEDAVARLALKAAQRGVGPRYRAVLIDEAQDFSTDALRFAVSLLGPGHDDLVVVADAAQNIFARRFRWKDAGIQAQGRTRVLRVNYRNTREILEFASRFLLAGGTLQTDEVPDPEDESVIIPPEAAVRTGERPTLHVVRSLEEEVATAVEQVRIWQRRWSEPRSIAVLYGSSLEQGKNRAEMLYQALKQLPGGVFWVARRQQDAKQDMKDRLAGAREPVVLSTIHSAKGLEFPCVVVCGIWRDDHDESRNRMLAYVGMTRAREKLAIVAIEGHPLTQSLRDADAAGAADALEAQRAAG